MYPRRPHDGSSGSPLSESTHLPQFSVSAGRGAPPRTGHAPPYTNPPLELTPAESAHYETNKVSTHKYKTYNKCVGKYPKLSPNAQLGEYRQVELLSHAQQGWLSPVRVLPTQLRTAA